MSKRTPSRWVFLAAVLLIVVLLGAIVLWWFLRYLPQTRGAPPPSPVSVTLLSPASGVEVEAGGFVPVTSKASAPVTIVKTEFFIDGQYQDAVTKSPESASWTWQAWPVGIHTIYAQVTDLSGEVGQSQVVIVNVLAGKGSFQIPAQDGQTLQQIGANYDVPPDQMAGANPHVDPSQPLQDGQPVNVPVPSGGNPGGGPNPPGGGGGASGPTITIIWQIQFSQGTDLAYCYLSTGDGQWERVPKDPFTFFQSPNNTYSQIIPVLGQVTLQAQCWGWVGGALQYLGEGQTTVDFNQPPIQVILSGQGFKFTGSLPTPLGTGGGPTKTVPPPYALREPSGVADCHSHGNLDCESFMNAAVKQYILLEWEWAKPFCWPGYCNYVAAINGFHLYLVDPVTKAETYIHDIANPGQREAALPLPWGLQCYGVRAYTNNPAYLESDITTYCPGEPPNTQKVTLYPTAWVTTGGLTLEDGDCSDFGGLEPYYGLYNGNVQIVTGSYIVDDSGCFQQGFYAGFVKFGYNIPPNAIVQKATLKFSTVAMDYGSPGWAAPTPTSCVAGIKKSKLDFSPYSHDDHYTQTVALYSSQYGEPITSINPYGSLEADVTSVVKDWTKDPSAAYGFILTGAGADDPKSDGYGRCLSGLGNFTVDVYYFAP
jgi:LysM repeat protein